MELGFWIPILSGIADSLSCIPVQVQTLRFYFASTDGKTLLCLLVTQIKFHACGGHWFGRVNENEKLTPSFLELLLFFSYAGNITPSQSAIIMWRFVFCQEVTFQGHLA